MLTKAEEARVENERAGARDKLAIEVLASYDNDGKLNADTLIANIQKHAVEGWSAEKGSEEGGFPVTVTVDGYTFEVQADGTIGKSKGLTISPSSLSIEEGGTAELTATISEDITGEISWQVADDSVVGIDPKTGNKTTVTVKGTVGANTTITATVTSSGETFTAKCAVTVTERKLTATVLSGMLSNKNGNSVIGKEVTGLTGGVCENYGWKLFYADSSNIYLIADSFIEGDDAPLSKGGVVMRPGMSSWPEDLIWGEEGFKDYLNGVADISIPSDRELEIELQNLNEEFKDLKTFAMQFVAYLLDSSVWKPKFVENNEKVKYVIGSPTIKQFLMSYNAKYETNYEAGAGGVDADGIGEYFAQNGYLFWDVQSGMWCPYHYLLGTHPFDSSDSTFLVDTPLSMVFSSPCDDPHGYADELLCLDIYGDLDNRGLEPTGWTRSETYCVPFF